MTQLLVELAAYGHALATCLMAGLVWFVQVVHYPLFARVGAEQFKTYESAHQSRTTLIVAPLMLTEAALGVVLLFVRPDGVGVWLLGANAGLLAVVWALTFLAAVPLHAKLSAGFDEGTHARLVSVNWPRTIAWTAKCITALLIARGASLGVA